MPKKLVLDNLNDMLRIATFSPRTTFLENIVDVAKPEEFTMECTADIIAGLNKIKPESFFQKIIYKVYLSLIKDKLHDYMIQRQHKEDLNLLPYDIAFSLNVIEKKAHIKVKFH